MAITFIVVWLTWPFILLFCADFAITAPSLQNVQEAGANPGVPLAGQPISKEWEEARQIWNGVRIVKKQLSINTERQRRMSNDQNPSPTANPSPDSDDVYLDLLNVSVPSYVKELYRNLSRQHKDSDEVDATTIRSIPPIRSGGAEGCGFNFSISELSSSEILRRAELRIHMKQPNGDQVNPVYLRLYHGKRKGGYKKVYPIREGWVVFDVLNEINHWRMANHPHKEIRFYIITYTSEEDLLKGQNGKNCHDSPIKFHQPTGTNSTAHFDDTMPLLMLYIHDLNPLKINVSSIIEATKNVTNRRSVSGGSSGATTQAQLQDCSLHNISINQSTFNKIWHLGKPEQTAMYPNIFDINVCGGQCHNNPPVDLPQHSGFLYYLYTRRYAPADYNNVEWTECCAPTKYNATDVLFLFPNDIVDIVPLLDLKVVECKCLRVIQPSSQAR